MFSHFAIFALENGIYDSVIEREAILDEHFPRKILHGLMLRVRAFADSAINNWKVGREWYTGWLPPCNPRTNNSDSNVGLLSRVGSFLPLSHEAPQSLNRPDETTTEPQFLVLRSCCGGATLTQVCSTRFGRLDSRLEERRKTNFS